MSAVFIVVLSLNALPAFSQSSDKKPTKVAPKEVDEPHVAILKEAARLEEASIPKTVQVIPES